MARGYSSFGQDQVWQLSGSSRLQARLFVTTGFAGSIVCLTIGIAQLFTLTGIVLCLAAVYLLIFVVYLVLRPEAIALSDVGIQVRGWRRTTVIPWASLTSIKEASSAGIVLRWRWQEGKITTWGGFTDQSTLFAEIARHSPNLLSIPG